MALSTPQLTTLVLFLKDDQILLAMKKRRFGAGLWNGIGGKLDPGETIEQAAVRECQEEVGMTPLKLEKVAIHDFLFIDDDFAMQVHTYLCRTWDGEPEETEEMAPKWFHVHDIPFDTMWQDDVYWLPSVLRGHKLKTTFKFDKANNFIDSYMQEVDTFDS